MLWDSILGALKILLHWETYVAGLEYLAIFFVPMGLFGLVMSRSEGAGGFALGCMGMLLLPILQVAALAVYILTMAPIIFGMGSDAAWAFPWQLMLGAPWAFAKVVGVLALAAIVIAFIPILGRLESLHTLVLGGIALVFVLGILENNYPGQIQTRVNLLPGFWFTVGLLVLGAVMAWIGTMVGALLATAIDMTTEGVGQLVMFPVAAVFGFVPVFLYGAWLGLQLRGAG